MFNRPYRILIVSTSLVACSSSHDERLLNLPATDAGADAGAATDADAADATTEAETHAADAADAVSEPSSSTRPVARCDKPDAPSPASMGTDALLGPVTEVPAIFSVPGSHHGDMSPDTLLSPGVCAVCHDTGSTVSPYESWSGSLMANAGRDPLFFAQLTTANQDDPGAGAYCQRCHLPVSAITGHALDPTGQSLDVKDRRGVICHVCHSMADPIFSEETSPVEDQPILDALAQRPSAYGNAMFVLDPSGLRRGPFPPEPALHRAIKTEFIESSNLCGTCHDVGNVTLSRQADGTYALADHEHVAPDADPVHQFPLQRTYTEWKLSAFAQDAVDVQGRFGGNLLAVSTCQDCHMPDTTGEACYIANLHPDLAIHEFAGAADWVLATILTQGGPGIEREAIERGRANARSMLSRAATLDLQKVDGRLRVRVTNQSGHKLPTGHIDGRRIFLSVEMLDASEATLREYGHRDDETGVLDEASTLVLEMLVGLSTEAARRTCLAQGRTGHTFVADTILKDTRIPPRGFTNAAFEMAGAPVVGASYEDGQYWAERDFDIPAGTVRAKVQLFYEVATHDYIAALRDDNITDNRGKELYDLWTKTDRAAPLRMVEQDIDLSTTP